MSFSSLSRMSLAYLAANRLVIWGPGCLSFLGEVCNGRASPGDRGDIR